MNFFFLRKKIINFYEALIPLKIKINNPIASSLKKAIFIFGITDFFYRKQRWQFLCEEFSKRIPIFYIDSSFLPKKRLKKEIFYSIYFHDNNLNIVKLSSDRNYFIYQEDPSEKGKKIIVESIKNLIHDYQIKKYIFILTHPFWYFLFDYFKNKNFIYDCLDDHQIFKENRKDIEKLEKIIVNKASTVIVTSDLLKEKIKSINSHKKIYKIKNGVSYDLVKLAEKYLKNSKDKKFFNEKKIVGYVGEINWWFDDEVLKKLVINFPDVNFYLIGKINNKKIKKLINKFKNLKAFGEIEYKNLAKFLKEFKIGLIPFKINQYTQAINPVKIYEYFAFGLPVFSSQLDEIRPYQDLVYFYNKENYIEAFKKALNENSLILKIKRNKIAYKNNWKNIADKYLKLIKKLIS